MRALALLAVAVLTARCGPKPCTHCPDVAGTYALELSTPTTQCDGDPVEQLLDVEPTQTAFTLTQDGPQLSNGALSGELTDDGDFVLLGSTDDVHQANFSVSARFSEPGTLRGQGVGTFSVKGPRMRDPDLGSSGPLIQTWVSCTVTKAFSGQRTKR